MGFRERGEMSNRRRCTECRKSYEPAPSARYSQRVCGAECRKARARKLARKRRRQDLEGFRADERARQQACRERRREGRGCHAPPSAGKCATLQEQIERIVDKALGLSRATLRREVREIIQERGLDPGEASAPVTHQPRAASG